jgi:hypothetical protein
MAYLQSIAFALVQVRLFVRTVEIALLISSSTIETHRMPAITAATASSEPAAESVTA